MRYSRVVDADNDDRVQDDDLTQEHDFFLRTFGTENMPTVDRFFHRINFIRNSNSSASTTTTGEISTSDSMFVLYKDIVHTFVHTLFILTAH